MTHRAFSVIKREGQEDYWVPEHADGKGYNVILRTLLIDGKLVLRVPKSDEGENRPPPHDGPTTEKNPAKGAGSRPRPKDHHGNAQSRRGIPGGFFYRPMARQRMKRKKTAY